MKKFLFTLSFLFTVKILLAQTDSTKSPLTFSGYLETYYSYDFNKPADHNRPGYFYSFARHNEFNLNLGFVKASYNDGLIRGNLALGVGSYMNSNYASEIGVLKNIFEANAGIKLLSKKDLWIDAGIFASHIGFESAIGKDCWNLTRSILAENSPYYLSGAKVTYNSDNGKWTMAGLIYNGWQQITRDSSQRIAFGTQFTFKPSTKVTLNSSTYFGSRPDYSSAEASNRNRYFHNFYGIFQFSEKLGIILGFDYGIEQKIQGSSDYNNWYSPVAIFKYSLSDKVVLAGRFENYNDKNGVIISTGTVNGFNTNGYSLNIDYLKTKNIVWRIEGRYLNSKDKIFVRDGNSVNDNFFMTTSLAISF